MFGAGDYTVASIVSYFLPAAKVRQVETGRRVLVHLRFALVLRSSRKVVDHFSCDNGTPMRCVMMIHDLSKREQA